MEYFLMINTYMMLLVFIVMGLNSIFKLIPVNIITSVFCFYGASFLISIYLFIFIELNILQIFNN